MNARLGVACAYRWDVDDEAGAGPGRVVVGDARCRPGRGSVRCRSARYLPLGTGAQPDRNGTWVPPASGYTYLWYRCGDATTASCTQPLVNETAQSYILRTADIGFHVRVLVTDSTGGGSALSNAARADLGRAAREHGRRRA